MESRKILVVEDEIDLEFLFTRTLKSHIRSEGWQLFFTPDGCEALQCLEEHPDIAVVVSDIKMPRMDGLTLLQHLNARYPLLRTIIITAYQTMDNIRAVMKQGAVDFLPKPLDMALLQRTLERTLQEVHQMRSATWTSRLLETALNTTEVGITITDQQGRIVYVNPADARMHGYTVDELLGQPGTIFGPPEQDARFPENLVFPWKRERLNRRKDGSVFPVALISNPMYDLHNRPSGKVVVCEDLTGRQRMEETLCLLMDQVADGLVVIQEGRVVQVNTALCAIFRETAEHLTRMDPETLLGAQASLPASSSLPAPDDCSWQVRQVTHGGRELWIETSQRTIHWVEKPGLLVTVRDITAHHKRLIMLRTDLHDRYRLGKLVGKSPAMQQVYERIAQAAATDEAVVICGESGTGKELVAKTIHQLSERANQAFVAVNCSAIPGTLFEREFFGHRKGAFTDAHADSPGLLNRAHQGTLLLDEVSELSLAHQAKLLRALDEGEYTPVGSETAIRADVRIIAATNQPLVDLVKAGKMRQDFFFRIRVIPITVPSLRERKEDLPLLVEHFLTQIEHANPRPALPGQIVEQLYAHTWPGNVRELRNAIRQYVTFGSLEFADLRNIEPDEPPDMSENGTDQVSSDLREAVAAFEKQHILHALNQHRWHRANTASALGIPERTLYRKLKHYGLTKSA